MFACHHKYCWLLPELQCPFSRVEQSLSVLALARGQRSPSPMQVSSLLDREEASVDWSLKVGMFVVTASATDHPPRLVRQCFPAQERESRLCCPALPTCYSK